MRGLRNTGGVDIEFQYGGRVFVVPAGKVVEFEDAVVKHYIGYVNGPLEEVKVMNGVKIANTTAEDKTYNGVTIKANSELELPKEFAKAFIRAVEGVDWIRKATPAEDKKKSEGVSESPVGEKGPEA